jgi:hypothetical protein
VNCIDQNLNNEIYILMYSKKTLSSSSIWSLKIIITKISFVQHLLNKKPFVFIPKRKESKKSFVGKYSIFCQLSDEPKLNSSPQSCGNTRGKSCTLQSMLTSVFSPVFFLYQHCKTFHITLSKT